MTMIEEVSNLTKFNFSEVYDLPAVDFFAYVLYVNHKIDKENQRIKDFQRKIK